MTKTVGIITFVTGMRSRDLKAVSSMVEAVNHIIPC